MDNKAKTRKQLLEELAALRARVSHLERGGGSPSAEAASARLAEPPPSWVTGVLETIADSLFVLDRQWRFVYLNGQALRDARKPAHELLGHSLWEKYPALLGTPLETHYRRAMAEQTPAHFEMRGLLSGRWLEVHAYPSPDGLVAYSRDASERKRGEDALRESEERHRLIVDLTSDYVYLVRFGPDGKPKLESVTEGFTHVTGYTLAELERKGGWSTLLHPDDYDAARARVPHLLSSDRPLVGEMRLVTQSGETRWVRYSTQPLREGDVGPVVGLLGAAQDITDRKRVEGALRESERRVRFLLEQMPAILWATDGQLRITLSVGAGLSRHGIKAGELVGKPLAECLGTEGELHPGIQAHRRALAGTTQGYESVWRGASYQVYVEPLRCEEGRIIGCIGACLDITERKRAESQLQEYARRLLETQERERRHVACELHDEVGQVLTGLRITLDVARRSSPDRLPKALDESQRLIQELTVKVRDLSLRLRPSMLDDFGLLPALLWHVKHYTDQTQVIVAFEHRGLEARLPPEVETAAYRIVQEALTNVARHAGTGRCAVRIWLEGSTLHLQIEDEGRGFDASPAQGRGPSTGLSGMRERATLLGGWLTVESAPGRGTLLEAELPVGG